MNLPQYTQALIDTGIQNRGIEHIVPEAITESEFQAASGYMDEEEKKLWEDSFEETGEKNDKGAAVLKRKDMTEDELLSSVLKADKYFFFESNIAFHDDGTRFSEDEAKQLSSSHINEYRRFGIDPEIVSCQDRYSVVEKWVLDAVGRLSI